MGALAAIVAWEQPVEVEKLDEMLAIVSHRAPGGVVRRASKEAAMGEAGDVRWQPDKEVATVGSLSIVADLRLWNLDSLRSTAGGSRSTRGLDDRQLLLEAYRRTGIDFLEAVDGDFAFVIWDAMSRVVIAARDRFGVKPLFYECTKSGIRFASEPKQLAVTAIGSAEPSDRSVAEFMQYSFEESQLSFLAGTNRVRASECLIADASRTQLIRYWNPTLEGLAKPSDDGLPDEFRDRLVDSVRRRAHTARGVVSHLSGGLDSSSISAAAAILAGEGELRAPFNTVSAVFPGHSNDESTWIDEIADSQPFSHFDFEPMVESVDDVAEDMWMCDGPMVLPIREMWLRTAELALGVDADLVLTGTGGDDVLDEWYLLSDLLRRGALGRWIGASHRRANWSGRRLERVLARSIRTAAPSALKSTVRAVVPVKHKLGLLRADVVEELSEQTVEAYPATFGFPSQTQDQLLVGMQHPLLVWVNEATNAQYASRGLDVSHPFLDRSLIEFVASIPPALRPEDGRTKPLIRQGFTGRLPPSILNRRHKSVADEYLADVFGHQAPEYRARYPEITPLADRYLDARRYSALLRNLDNGDLDIHRRYTLWSGWLLMTWLDGLARYRPSTRPSRASSIGPAAGEVLP